MGEIVVVVPIALVAASLVVVPFLGWGMADPGAQWERIQHWRKRDVRLSAGDPRLTWHSIVNGVALLAWLALLLWLFRTVG